MTFAERLYEAFGDASISWEAAKAIGEIAQADSILTKANHAEVKVCYFKTDSLQRMKISFVDPLRAKICECCSATHYFIC